MRQRLPKLGFILTSLAALLAWPQAAGAKHVVVLSVSGPGYKKVRRFLESEIEKDHKLISVDTAIEAARKLGISRRRWLYKNKLPRLAAKIQADAVVSARIYKYGGRWWIGLQIRDGDSGRTVKQGLVRYRWFALNAKNKSVMRRILTAGIDKVEGVPHPRRRAATEDPLPRVTKPKKKKKKSPLGPRPAWMTGIHVGLGVEVYGRKLSFKNVDGVPGTTTAYETDTPIVPLYLDIEAYPGAFFSRNAFLANLGVGFNFRWAFNVVSYRENDAAEITTRVMHLGTYLTWRWNVKKSIDSPVINFDLGIEVAEFGFDVDLGPVPSVLYVSFKPGIRGMFSLVKNRLGLGFLAAGMATFSKGQIADNLHYGTANAGGFQLGLELSVRLFWKMYLRVGFETTWYLLSFKQIGTQGTDFEYVANSASDGFYGGYALVAVQF